VNTADQVRITCGIPLHAKLAACAFAAAVCGSAQALTAGQCAALTTLAVPATTITGAALVPAAGVLPEYCRVSGHVDTEINFELRLPSNWNGKFYHQGGGGFVGSIPPAGPGLSRGYAAVATDTGHQGTGVAALDGAWALNNPQRQLNFGHRAVHVVTVAAKQIVAAAYGRAASRSYFEGCSNGGRQAMMEAQRYPADFDGIIAGAPALDWTGLMTGFNYNQQAVRSAPIPPEKLSVIAKAVVAKCDAKDGLVDGLVDNPRRCGFDPSVVQCTTGDAANCLTAAQVATVRKVYDGPVNSRGEQLHPGFPPGAEDGGSGWQLWISGPSGVPVPPVNNNPFQFTFSDHYLRFMVFSDPTYDSMTFDFDNDTDRVDATAPTFSATNPNLAPFRARGGKLLVWHGWADHALMADRSIEYYNDVIRTMGNKNKVEDFFRLFLAPGMHHCSGGPGLNSFDALTALENWVEQGRAPNSLLASHVGSGVQRTRPLCSYPKVAVYNGKGNPNSAASFSCAERGLGYSLGSVPD
jgi:feruloyl esterase